MSTPLIPFSLLLLGFWTVRGEDKTCSGSKNSSSASWLQHSTAGDRRIISKDTTYTLVSSGDCIDTVGYTVINSSTECKAALDSLEDVDLSVFETVYNIAQPPGCVWKQNVSKGTFNVFQSGISCTDGKSCVCKVTTTTTTTAYLAGAVDFTSTHYKFIRIMPNSALNEEFTVSMWVQRTASSTDGRVISHQRWSGSGWSVKLEDNQLAFNSMCETASGGTGNVAADDTMEVDLALDTWVHYAAVFSTSGGYLKTYKDGSLLGTVSHSMSVQTDATQAITIGREWDETCSCWTGSTNLQNGRKAEGVQVYGIAVWDTPLSDTDISSIYNAACPTKYPSTSNLIFSFTGINSDGCVTNLATSITPECLYKQDSSSDSSSTTFTTGLTAPSTGTCA